MEHFNHANLNSITVLPGQQMPVSQTKESPRKASGLRVSEFGQLT